MAELATGYVNILPSTKGLGKAILSELGEVQDKAGGKAEQSGKGLGNRMAGGFKSTLVKGLGLAVGAVAAVGIGSQLKDAIMGAGDYEQSVGAITAVFKDQAGEMFGYAQDSAKAVGLSKNAYQELATVLGSQLKNGGMAVDEIGGKTNDLIGLGADLASMFGGTTAEAVEAMSSALRGESDPIERYGVSVSAAKVEAEAMAMGAEKVNGELTTQAKQAAILSLIYKQTKDAQGNFARETDTFAGKLQIMSAEWENLKMRVGEMFLPVLTKTFGFITDTVLPILGEGTGAIRAFFFAFKAGNGDITSDGFAGTMERIGYQARLLYDDLKARLTPAFKFLVSVIRDGVVPILAALGRWLYDNRDLIKGILVVVLPMVGAWFATAKAVGAATAGYAALAGRVGKAVAFIKSLRNIVLAARIGFVMLSVVLRANPIGVIVTALTGLVIGLRYAYNNIGWFKDAVDAAWSGIVTATQWLGGVFAGAWSGIKDAAAAVAQWWTDTLAPALRAGVDGIVAGFQWLAGIASAVWSGIRFVIALQVGLVVGLFTLIVRAVRAVLAPIFRFLLDNVVRPVMSGVRAAVAAVAAWFAGTLVPGFRAALDALGRAFRWLYATFVAPVVAGIRRVVDGVRAWFAGTLVPAFKLALGVLGAAFRWLRDTFVTPVVSAVRRLLDGFRAWFANTVVAGLRAGLGRIGDGFRFLRDGVVRPVWDRIRNLLADGWAAIKRRVFDPLVRFTRDTIPNAFQRAKDGVKKQWDKLKAVVSGPVGFVIDHVINDPLIKSVNSVLRSVGLKDKQIGEVKSGFFHGGRTGGTSPYEERGVVHGKEFVLTAQRTAELDRLAPGLLDGIHKHGAKALAGLTDPARMAPGAFLPSYGVGSWVGSPREAIYRSGVMNVAGSAPGYDLAGAIAMLDRATRVKVKRGPAGANGVRVSSGNLGQWWAGYQAGNNVWLNDGIAGGMNAAAKRVLIAHELGHALGLPHNARRHGGNGAWSMMNYDNMYRHNSVTAADVSALSAIYGGSGFASGGGSSVEDVPGIIARLVKPIHEFIGNMTRRILDKFPGGGTALDLVKGAANLVGDGVKGWLSGALSKAKDAILDKVGGVTDWVGDRLKGLKGLLGGAAPGITPALYDNGGLIHRGVQLIDHQRSAPDKVLTDEQWRTMASIAKSAAAGPARRTRDEDRPTVQVVVPEREGIAPDHFGQRVGESAAWALTKAGL